MLRWNEIRLFLNNFILVTLATEKTLLDIYKHTLLQNQLYFMNNGTYE